MHASGRTTSRLRLLGLCLGLGLAGAGDAGCGGAGGKPVGGTWAFYPVIDASITSTGSVQSGSSNLIVGDWDETNTPRGVRAVLRFLVGGLPAGSHLVVANLRLAQGLLVGGPFPSFGPVSIDHVTLGPILDASDYSFGTLSANFATVSTDPLFGTRSVNVTDQIQADLDARRAWNEFRLHFILQTNANGTPDATSFGSRLATEVSERPVLLVTYDYP